MDNYKDYPISVSEQRAADEHDAALWTPRDLLLSMLRDIDNGTKAPTDIVLCYAEGENEGGYMRAGKSPNLHISHIEIAKHRIIQDMFAGTRA